MLRLNWYLPRYCPPDETAVGSPPDSHSAIRRRMRGSLTLLLLIDCAAAERAQAERGARLGADDAVDRQALAALEALDGPLGLLAEDAVRADAERSLQRAHRLAAVAALEHGLARGACAASCSGGGVVGGGGAGRPGSEG